jgi:hypothetical protein
MTTPGFKGGDRPPVVDQSLAAELGVATVLGAQQPVAGDLATLLSQFGLKDPVGLACRAAIARSRRQPLASPAA